MLVRRVLGAARFPAVAVLTAVAMATGCGAKVAVDLDGGTGGTGGHGGSSTGWMGSGGLAGLCGPTTKVPGKDQFQLTECFKKPSSGCPNQYDAPLHIVPTQPCVYLVSVDCGPFPVNDSCCYGVTLETKPCGK